MTWTKLSDDLWRHRKVAAIDQTRALECMGLWTLALSKAGADLSDGYITDRSLLQVAGRDVNALAAELCRVGLWERVPGGYQFHDYLDCNASAYEILTLIEVRKAAGSAGGKARVKGAKRSGRGQFTKQTAGEDAGDLTRQVTKQTPSPVTRYPYPVSPVPVSISAADDSAAITERGLPRKRTTSMVTIAGEETP